MRELVLSIACYESDMANRFRKYLCVIIAVAVISAVFCMAATDIFWGLLISVGVVPITCLFFLRRYSYY